MSFGTLLTLWGAVANFSRMANPFDRASGASARAGEPSDRATERASGTARSFSGTVGPSGGAAEWFRRTSESSSGTSEPFRGAAEPSGGAVKWLFRDENASNPPKNRKKPPKIMAKNDYIPKQDTD